MKTLKTLILICAFICLLSCAKNENEIIYEVEVIEFVEQLKANAFESQYLPEFSPEHLPTLFDYINNNSMVNKFPSAPWSSYHDPNPDYRLGVLVLWTIESIRIISSEGDKNAFLGFPSQNPFVQTKNEPVEWILNHDDTAYEIVRRAYTSWWEDNKGKNYSDFDEIDPLEITNFRWH